MIIMVIHNPGLHSKQVPAFVTRSGSVSIGLKSKCLYSSITDYLLLTPNELGSSKVK